MHSATSTSRPSGRSAAARAGSTTPSTCARGTCTGCSRPCSRGPPVLFNSYEFLFVFLPLVLLGWWGLRPAPLRLAFLTAASYVFYAWWDWRFLPLMIASTTVDYAAGRALVHLDDGPRRR